MLQPAAPPCSPVLFRPQSPAGSLPPTHAPHPQQTPAGTLNSDFLLYSSKNWPEPQRVAKKRSGWKLRILRIRSQACRSSAPVETRELVKGSPGDRVGQRGWDPSHLSPLLILSPPRPPRCPSGTARSGLPTAVSSYNYQGVWLIGNRVRITSLLQARSWVPREGLGYPRPGFGQLGTPFPPSWS